MNGTRQQALLDARKLVRTFAAAPDARNRARAVISELKHADGWSAAQIAEIAATETWLGQTPSVTALEGRLRELLAALA